MVYMRVKVHATLDRWVVCSTHRITVTSGKDNVIRFPAIKPVFKPQVGLRVAHVGSQTVSSIDGVLVAGLKVVVHERLELARCLAVNLITALVTELKHLRVVKNGRIDGLKEIIRDNFRVFGKHERSKHCSVHVGGVVVGMTYYVEVRDEKINLRVKICR